jgi:NAD(P)-dependent dehydrogenase (short-subunit alcohol dehydrogenase family)
MTKKRAVALVTGAGSGIGRATAQLLAKRGLVVALTDIDEATGQHTERLIAEADGEASFVRADASDEAQMEAAVSFTLDTFGALDVAVNNAGFARVGDRIHEVSQKDWDDVMAVVLRGVWLCMRAEIAAMLEQGGGSIVNVASIAGLAGSGNRSGAYSAAKHGVVGLTRTAALEYARDGIRVNAVCPGQIATPRVEARIASDPEMAQRLVGAHPMGRLGRVEEVAEAIAWLCSPASSFVNGHPLAVDGGFLAG